MYSPLKKQTKTIENQREKQIIANQKSNAVTKKQDYIGKNDSPDFMNQIETFNKLVDERKYEIFKLN